MFPDRYDHPWELRAARNQSLFRAVNERLRRTDADAAEEKPERYVIACECADVRCVGTIEIGHDAYGEIRRNPKRFPVLHGHVYSEVEDVLEECEGYVVVEKHGAAAAMATALWNG